MVEFHKQFQREVETNNQKWETLMTGIDKKFNFLMKMMTMERATLVEKINQLTKHHFCPPHPYIIDWFQKQFTM